MFTSGRNVNQDVEYSNYLWWIRGRRWGLWSGSDLPCECCSWHQDKSSSENFGLKRRYSLLIFIIKSGAVLAEKLLIFQQTNVVANTYFQIKIILSFLKGNSLDSFRLVLLRHFAFFSCLGNTAGRKQWEHKQTTPLPSAYFSLLKEFDFWLTV